MSKKKEDAHAKQVLNMTAQTIGKDLLSMMVLELKMLPNPWPKLSKAKQDDVIDRMRSRLDSAIRMAVHLISAEGRTVVEGALEQVTIKDGVKATVKFMQHAANLHHLYESAGKVVLLAVASPDEHLGGLEDVKGEADQRAMDLGHEYDPDGDGKGMDKPWDEDGVIDGEVKALPDTPLDAELDAAYNDGRAAAEAGKPKSECPIGRHEIVASWTQGWTDWHAENPQRDGQDHDEDHPAGEPA